MRSTHSALVELLFALEQEFSVSVPFDTLDIESFRSIETIAELIAALDDGDTKAASQWA